MWRRASDKLLALRPVARPNRIVRSSLSPATLRSSPTVITRHYSGPLGTKHGMRFSTSVPNDPDTHDDFKPTNKLENSQLTLKDIVEQDVKDNHVMIYMKGDPEQPRCGFSSLAVRVLSEYRVPIHSRNILEDPELKNAVKSFSMWPTFPQIFINGEFIGGSDIILNMHQNGELKEKIKATPSE
ncbi:monothiol glutaredoxin-S15, mitochondrial isoform X2 [Lactuca sativa]|uniref:monothiol glutaredoxin-S15, mitochondrial isoform X2 n=1 Tax=Lactuca sativa TaxID=4236 RepID=UPI000CD86424|nr:monothiol glutaredoxin-S15, mitochondrial isoform X2 [Lactuca sativa]